jgi:hypothetical protein
VAVNWVEVDCATRNRLVDRLVVNPEKPLLVRTGLVETWGITQETWAMRGERNEVLQDETVWTRTGHECRHWVSELGQVKLAAHLMNVE